MSEQWEVKTISGAAWGGGSNFQAEVNLKVNCNAHTVEEVRCKVQAFPDLFKACKAIAERWEHGDLAEAARMCSDAVKLAMGEKPAEVKACSDCHCTDSTLYECPDGKSRCLECCDDVKYNFD